jgi:hypothetical protein
MPDKEVVPHRCRWEGWKAVSFRDGAQRISASSLNSVKAFKENYNSRSTNPASSTSLSSTTGVWDFQHVKHWPNYANLRSKLFIFLRPV